MQLKMLLLMLFVISSAKSEEMIDLSYTYDANTPYWIPSEIPFRFIQRRADWNRGFWYASNQFETAEHGGTHLDAPYHFYPNGWKVHEIPLSRLITTGVFLNASSATNGNCSYKLPANELQKWESEHGPFPENSILLVSFGWASRVKNKRDYFGPFDELCFPGLSEEAAKWITNCKKIVGVGLDTPSIDQGPNVEAHIELSAKNMLILENVALTKPLPPTFKIIALPIKIGNGTGGPCRIVAII